MVCASVAGASGWTNLDERSGHPVQEALGELGRLGAAGFVDHAFGAVLEKITQFVVVSVLKQCLHKTSNTYSKILLGQVHLNQHRWLEPQS